MQLLQVTLAYGLAIFLALALLSYFEAKWFWHALSLAAALAVGLAPLPPEWRIPDMLLGAVFLFLFVWGVGMPVFRHHHHSHHRKLHHA
jgi:hypothetical protein